MAKRGRKKKVKTNPLELLRSEHEEIKSLYAKYAPEIPERREEISGQIFKNLRAHSALEEEFFYPALEAFGTDTARTMAAKNLAEHKTIKDLAQELTDLDPEDPDYNPKFSVLMQIAEKHMQEEEDEVFPEVEEYLGLANMEQMAQRMEESRHH